MVKCPKCGKENIKESKFCEECGSLLENKLKSSNDNNKKRNKKPIKSDTSASKKATKNDKIILAILLIGFVVGGSILFLTTSNIFGKDLKMKNYSNEDFNIFYPEDWKLNVIKPSTLSSGQSSYGYLNIEDYNDKFKTISVYKKNSTQSLEELVKTEKSDLQYLLHANILSEKSLNVNGIDAVELIYTFREVDGTTIKHSDVLIKKSGDATYYLVMCGCKESDYSWLKPNYDKVINSFKPN